MPHPDHHSIAISPDIPGAPLSKAQKAFNALIARIDKRRERLAQWEVAIPPFHRKFSRQLVPLDESIAEVRKRIVQAMDVMSTHKGLSKKDAATLGEVITVLAAQLVARDDDPTIKEIYNRYSGHDFDAEFAAGEAEMKASLAEAFGVELGDDVDFGSPDDVVRHVQEQVEQRQKEAEAERHAHQQRRAEKKKTKKQQEAEARREAEEQEASVSIREVYRKLVSALHPDRESDPVERERKTLLMKRVNDAYGRKSLLQLLELQLELEHIDQAALDNMTEERLKNYTRIMKEQLAGLDEELHHVEANFRYSYGMPPTASVNPGTVERNLTREIEAMKQQLRAFEGELTCFADIRDTRDWIRWARVHMRTGGGY